MISTIQETMGKITTTLTITNHADQIRCEDGAISAEQIRSITIKNVLVDTGATIAVLTKVRYAFRPDAPCF